MPPAKTFSVDAFRNKMVQDVQTICKDEGWKFEAEQGRGFAFQKWAASLICAHEGIDEDKITTFSTNDLKFDVVIEDDDQKVIYYCQTKFLSTRSSSSLSETEVHDFFARHELLLQHVWVHEHANDQLLEFVGDYADRLRDGWQVHFYFVGTGLASDRIKKLIPQMELKVQLDYPGVFFNLLDFYGLKEYYVEAQTLEAELTDLPVEFDIPRNKWLQFERPRPTLVAVVKANTLINLYKTHRERIFAVNIRSFLGRKGLNRDISGTAEKYPEDFFLFQQRRICHLYAHRV